MTESALLDLLKTGGIATMVVGVLVFGLWKLGGRLVDAAVLFFEGLIAELKEHRVEEGENHREALAVVRRHTAAINRINVKMGIAPILAESTDDEDERSDVTPIPVEPPRNGKRRSD